MGRDGTLQWDRTKGSRGRRSAGRALYGRGTGIPVSREVQGDVGSLNGQAVPVRDNENGDPKLGTGR